MEIKKVKVRRCPECEELSLSEEFEVVNCFKLSDFEDMARGNDNLIPEEDVLKLNTHYTLEVFKCPYCDDLFEDFQEKEVQMWTNDIGEFYKTKKEALDNN